MSSKSPPTSPARPPPARAGSVQPTTPDRPSQATRTPGSSPAVTRSATAPPATPDKKPEPEDKDKDKGKDKDKKDEPKQDEPKETIPDALEKLDIDESVFSQITEMDDEDPECEFSREIVVDYFKQAKTTFKELREALKAKDLKTLSAKGHFLKGSSAALGIKKVQESCEHVQHYGAKRDEINNVNLTEEQALARVALIMPRLERDYELAAQWLRNYYRKQDIDLDEQE